MTDDRAAAVLDALIELRETHADQQRTGGAKPRLLSRADLVPALRRLDITRVGDLTGLDVLTVPVWFATRPLSRSLCVSNGKGLTADSAWVSAVMESAEQALAERAADLVATIDTPAGLARRGLTSVPLERQSRCAASALAADAELAWVEGMSWRTGEAVYAPYELVGMDMASDTPWNQDDFRMASVGLASSGDLAGAIRHGVEELVEDDAIFAHVSGGARRGRAVEFSSNHISLVEAVRTLEAHGVACLFADVTDDIDAPTIMAALQPVGDGEPRYTYYGGYACRERPEDAALAALLEAVQSRLTFISGAREDLFAEEYRDPLTAGTEAAFTPCRWIATEHAGADVASPRRTLIDRVIALGLDIYVFPLGGRDLGFEVVRVLADDLVSVHGPSLHPRTRRAGDKLLRAWGRQ